MAVLGTGLPVSNDSFLRFRSDESGGKVEEGGIQVSATPENILMQNAK